MYVLGTSKEMAQAGHEITNHGWMHKNLTKLVGKKGVLKYNIMIRLFLSKQVYFAYLFYPGNRKNEEAIACASVDRVGTVSDK